MTEATFLPGTSTILWTLAEPARVSSAARTALKKTSGVERGELWGGGHQNSKGLVEVGNPIQWWSRVHKDPFDRLLIAQAREERLILLGNDEMIRRYPIKTLW